MKTIDLLLYFTIASFLFFGMNCIVNPRMRLEFNRYGLNTLQRLLTGILQVMGAAGLTYGIFNAKVGIAASAGLCLLMFFGLIVRIKIKDDVYKSSPALVFMVISGILCYHFIKGV
jgi:hypothetical protein